MTGNRKKGVSIGAAMKQRMANGDGDDQKRKAPDIAIAPAMLEPTQSAVEADDVLESFNTRLPRSLQKRLKVYAVVHGSKIQDVLQAALSEYLDKHTN